MAGDTADGTCTLAASDAVTTVRVGTKRSVTYEFDTKATKADLALPYVVSINDRVLPEYSEQPRALSGKARKISLVVDPGSRVALFLNSDVHPDHRRHPVYAVQVGANDVLVKITERKGRIGHERSTLRTPFCRPSSTPGKSLEVYEAALTGDIWMEISHLYTVSEAEALLPAGTSPAVRDAVRRIYAGLPTPELVVKFTAADAVPVPALRVRFEESDNVLANITHCPFLTGVLPRSHPRSFAALLTEASSAGVTELRVTSGWRPMLGSIVHRTGLGLDITYAEGQGQRVHINRAALTDSAVPRSDNGRARDQDEPKLVHALRDKLCGNSSIKQVFDPWYMEGNTLDNKPPVPNEQLSPNERLHNNHLHVTVLEPKILP